MRILRCFLTRGKSHGFTLIELMIVALGVVWLAITSAGGDVVRLLADKRFLDAATVVPYIAGAVFFHGVLSE